MALAELQNGLGFIHTFPRAEVAELADAPS